MAQEVYRSVFYDLLYSSLLKTVSKYQISQLITEDNIVLYVIQQFFEIDWFNPKHPLYETFNLNRRLYNDMRHDWSYRDAKRAFDNAKIALWL